MKKSLPAIVLLLTAILALGGCGTGPTTEAGEFDWDFYNQRAEAFVTAMAAGDYPAAQAMLDPTMASLMDASELQALWERDVIGIAGPFESIIGIRNSEENGFLIASVTMRHQNTGFGWNIVFDHEGRVAGLWTTGTVALPPAPMAGQTAEPVSNAGFTEYPVTIGEGTDFPVNGLLAIPDNATGPVPAALIVGGSGTHDRDGTMFGQTPYRDIAQYLAANGIATLRFDRRLYTHAQAVLSAVGGALTVQEEIIDDALLAVELLKADPRIDPDRVFLIGHSLGANLAPRIAAAIDDFAGLILLAGSPRDLLEVALGQFEESLSSAIAEGLLTSEPEIAAQTAQVEAFAEFIQGVPELTTEQAQATSVPLLGASAYYFQELARHPFSEYAAQVSIPVLILQGGRDFQVRADLDLVLLQQEFSNNPNVTVHVYENLNHLFMPTTATNFTQHAIGITTEPGHVAPEVLADITNWINAAAG